MALMKTVMKLANIVICVLMIIGGFGRIFENLTNPVQLVISVYIMGFGVLLLFAELKSKGFFKNFAFRKEVHKFKEN